MVLIRNFSFLIYLVFSTSQVMAGPVQISLSDLLPYGMESTGNSTLDPQVEADIRAALSSMGAEIDAAGLTLSFQEQDIPLDSGCENATKLESLQAKLTLLDDSIIMLDLPSLAAQNSVSFELNYRLDAQGRFQQKVGEKFFGRCYVLGKDSFDLSVKGTGVIRFDALLDLGLQQSQGFWTAMPDVTLSFGVDADDYQVDVAGSFIAERAKRKIEEAVNDSLDANLLDIQVTKVESQVQAALEQILKENGLIEPPGLETSRAVEQLINADLLGAVGGQYITQNYPMMARAAFSQNTKGLVDLVAQAASCELASNEREDMPSSAVYSLVSGSCEAVNPAALNQKQTLYFDTDCQQPFDFIPTSWVDYCSETLDSLRLGNGLLHSDFINSWQLSPGTSLKLGVEPVSDNFMPWMTRRIYKETVKKEVGICALEMRVYKRSIGEEKQKPLLMLHGGAWNSRVLGFVGMEAMISHYTDAGFVVFAPFYRLTESDEATAACHDVKGEDILDDVEDALAWVNEHQSEFGSEGPVYLFGQSAGAHLALSLAYYHPKQVKKAVLMYPPTDFAHLVQQYQSGQLSARVVEGERALESFLGRELLTVSVNDPDIVANSFPEKIHGAPERTPPVFILHGVKDQVVPVDQSIRLCNSYSAEDLATELLPLNGLREKFSCGADQSQMHLFAEGDHALDACVFSLYCPAGSTESQTLVADSLREARSWLMEPENVAQVKADAALTGSNNGGGALGSILLLLAIARLLSGSKKCAGAHSPSTPTSYKSLYS
ncbi:MAG: alpha/beta hydrolase [Thiotrichales bacterium]